MDEFQTVENQEADEGYCAWLNEMDRQMNERAEHQYYSSGDVEVSNGTLEW